MIIEALDPANTALNAIKKKWTIEIVYLLNKKAFSFKSIKEFLPSISDKVVSKRLLDLQDSDLIKKLSFSRKSVKYYLTERGKIINNLLYQLSLLGYTLRDNESSESLDLKKELAEQFDVRKNQISADKLGYFELCFDVKDMVKSVEFYKKLGFEISWGDPISGTCVMYNGDIRFALFGDKMIEREFGVKFLFNFRGGDIDQVFDKLSRQSIDFEMEPENFSDGVSRHAKFRDLDGNLFYLDTHPDDVLLSDQMEFSD